MIIDEVMTLHQDSQWEKSALSSGDAREAVELLLLVLNWAVLADKDLLEIVGYSSAGNVVQKRCLLDALYQAMIRIILRLVIIFLVESRDLLPQAHPYDHRHHSLEYLLDKLRNPAQHASCDPPGAWSHLLRLFALLHAGFVNDQLLLPIHGGPLFQPGSQDSSDTIVRAISLFESLDSVSISDNLVLDLLEAVQKILVLGTPNAQRCRTEKLLSFSEIYPEHVGLIYQTLLAFQLQFTDQLVVAWHGEQAIEIVEFPLFSLINCEGVRKGSGSFYTCPQLACALAQKTLMPLVFTTDDPNIPRLPDEILALKVCDPACGSASFLLAALRYLTDVLYRSVCYYHCLDEPFQEQSVKKNLRCQIAQQCLYGVDLSSLAVELARICLWIEISDSQFSFAYLDQDIKVGNALIGASSRTYQDYPLLAWMREGGDSDHKHGVQYHEKAQARALHAMRDKIIKPELDDQIATRSCYELYPVLRDHTLACYQELKQIFDEWCAIWFWPIDQLAHVPTPASYQQRRPATSLTRQIVTKLVADLEFFHWEVEFPAVFQRPAPGFDAILANPPWETTKLCSREFFSVYDPLYCMYGKQEALVAQQSMFQRDHSIEHAWLCHQASFKNMSNWVKYSGSSDQAVPFRYQGSVDLNTYKLFLEKSHYLLRTSGYLGMICPSGIYTDQGTAALRQLFLDHCDWSLLFGFSNRRRIFDIHASYKFVALLIAKGGSTDHLRVTFNREDVLTFEHCEPDLICLPREQIKRFSPFSLTIIEAQGPRDLAILEKLYTNTALLGAQSAQSWRIRYGREFDMTNDASLFSPIELWQQRGYYPDRYGRWIHRDGSQALPVYEGRMIGAFDPVEKGWIHGKGRRALWRDIPWAEKVFEPQYLMSLTTYQARENACQGNKIGFMDISSATNVRSMYATFIAGLPCGNVVPTLQPANSDIISILALIANLNSYSYDYLVRCRLGGLHLNYFVIAETPLLPPAILCPTMCAQLAARLNLIMPCFAPQWLELRSLYPALGQQHWYQLWAVTEHERLRLRCILDALIADLYALEYSDLSWILRHDPHNPKGFWRVDKSKTVALRHTTLTLLAFEHLKMVGREAFVHENWQFPLEIASQLGPRLLPWQTEGTVEESWNICQAYAQQILNGC